MIRVLIIEDEIIIARFIEQQLKANFECNTAIALNEKEVREVMPGLNPQLVLCDINLKEQKDGIRLVEELRHGYMFDVIFITSYQSKGIIERALVFRPLNYLIKPVDEASIYACLKLAWGSIREDNTVTDLRKQLTATELHIVQLILQNKTSRDIAAELFISPYTVKNHRHSICRKLGLNNGNNALLQWAMLHKGELES